MKLFALTLLAFCSASAFAQETLPIPLTSSIVREEIPGFEVKKAIINVGSFKQVDGLLLLDAASKPEMANIGFLQLPGKFDASTIIAEDMQRNQVKVTKVSEQEWLIKGTGRIIIAATLGTKEPFSLESKRYDVFIPALGPDKPLPGPDPIPEPDKPDPKPSPTVPEDRFGNLGQRVSALAGNLPLRKEVAANYRQFAEQLKGSIEVAQVSQAMVAKRDLILKDVSAAWMPVMTLVLQDFTARRPEMVRADVVDHWLAVANGLDPK